MSDIALSPSVRQNLLSLQSTAELLATTQIRLSTGKKVNTALDNPANYFTAAGLDNRANDISNLLDGIGNGVQVLQAANAGLTSSNDNASQILTLGAVAAANTIAIGGTDTAVLVTPTGGVAGKPLADAASQTLRSNLVSQYNNIIAQITTTAQDASFNGINLLNGYDLKLTFNETGKSTLTIKGVTFDAAGLSLASLVARPHSFDNPSAYTTLATISSASNALRTETSTPGSSPSVWQIRQDFSKNLINVLQTGSA